MAVDVGGDVSLVGGAVVAVVPLWTAVVLELKSGSLVGLETDAVVGTSRGPAHRVAASSLRARRPS